MQILSFITGLPGVKNCFLLKQVEMHITETNLPGNLVRKDLRNCPPTWVVLNITLKSVKVIFDEIAS